MIDAVIEHSADVDALSDVTETPKKKEAKQKQPSMDWDGNVKQTRVPIWHKDEDRLIEKYMENRETLTAELKGAGGKGGRVTSEMKD